jgi:GNAT superfamily N-acetyltransferase
MGSISGIDSRSTGSQQAIETSPRRAREGRATVKFDASSVLIQPLGPDHDRAAFSCGNDSLDRYIRTQATQDTRRGIARIFVATLVNRPQHILAFFTLSAASVGTSELPPEVAKRLPRHPIPAALIGRLAVDREFAGRGLGSILLADAVKKTVAASQTLAVTVLVVDPIDDGARAFYSSFGFRSLQAPQERMFLVLRSDIVRA